MWDPQEKKTHTQSLPQVCLVLFQLRPTDHAGTPPPPNPSSHAFHLKSFNSASSRQQMPRLATRQPLPLRRYRRVEDLLLMCDLARLGLALILVEPGSAFDLAGQGKFHSPRARFQTSNRFFSILQDLLSIGGIDFSVEMAFAVRVRSSERGPGQTGNKQCIYIALGIGRRGADGKETTGRGRKRSSRTGDCKRFTNTTRRFNGNASVGVCHACMNGNATFYLQHGYQDLSCMNVG